MTKQNTGVVIDAKNYYVGAVSWSTPDERPRFKKQTGLKLILDAEAQETGGRTDGRWNTETKKWLWPTEAYVLVRDRIDLPRYAALLGEKQVWPDNLPQTKKGERWIKQRAPEGPKNKIMWDHEDSAWVSPKVYSILDSEGVEVNKVLALAEEHVKLDEGQTAVTDYVAPARVTQPEEEEINVEDFKAALQGKVLYTGFQAFLASKGYSENDLEGLETISYSNNLIQEWSQKNKINDKQLRTAIQGQKAERIKRMERLRKLKLGETNV